MAGAVACNLLLATKDGGVNSDPLLVLEMSDNETTQYAKWELGLFVVMGILFGWLAHFYLLLHKRISKFMSPYNRDIPLCIAAGAALFTAIVVYATGQYGPNSVGVVFLVSDVFNKGKVVEMTNVPLMAGRPMEGLLLACGCRVLLTLIGTNILVPAGIFMPVTLIGGLLGRLVGHLVYEFGHQAIYIPGYALVGACAFAAGITHTISVAVIAVEMTGDLKMLLPCLVVSVIAAGITKANGISVYDIGMINKGLETFQLLLLERDGTHRQAGSIMDDQVAMIPQTCTVQTLIKHLELTGQKTFPLIDASSNREPRLIGSMQRSDIYNYLAILFQSHGLLPVLRAMLPTDTEEHNRVESLKGKSRQLRLERAKYKKILSDVIFRSPPSSDKAAAGSGGRGNGAGPSVGNPLHSVRNKTGRKGAKKGGKGAKKGAYALVVEPSHVVELDGVDVESALPHMSNASSLLIENDAEVLVLGYSQPPDELALAIDTSVRDRHPVTPSSGKSNKSVESNDSGFGWNALNYAAQSVINGLGLSPTNSPQENGIDLPFRFDPLDTRVVTVFGMMCNCEHEEHLQVNYFPFSINERAPMEQLYILFEMVKMSTIFVINNGNLKGMISRDRLLESLKRR